jgi:FdhE protein
MSMKSRDQTILADVHKAKSVLPDLDELLTFYEKVFRLQFAFKDRLAEEDGGGYWATREIHLQALETGFPQIRFEELRLKPAQFQVLYQDILKLLIPYSGAAADRVPQRSPERVREYAREIFISQGPPVVSGTSEDIVKSAGGLALAPYLYLACEGILPRIPSEAWHRGTCPVCGGNPSFAALISDTGPRTLLCPRCFGEWSYGRIGCPFCKDRESQSYYSSEDGRHRLYVCAVCRRYLKTADARERGADLCLPVANLVTVGMDLGAREKGFT